MIIVITDTSIRDLHDGHLHIHSGLVSTTFTAAIWWALGALRPWQSAWQELDTHLREHLSEEETVRPLFAALPLAHIRGRDIEKRRPKARLISAMGLGR